MRKCKKCGKIKKQSEYYPQNQKYKKRDGTVAVYSGLTLYCKPCHSKRIGLDRKIKEEKYTEYREQYDKVNEAKKLEYRRNYCTKNRERINARMRKFRKDNPETVYIYRKRYELKHGDEIKTKKKAYREKNRISIREKALAAYYLNKKRKNKNAKTPN